MNTLLEKARFQNFDDIREDIPEKRSLPRTILDLLLSPT